MKTPIDFGKDFLYKFFDQRDADACQKMLAGDLVWITPENMHHFLSEGAVLKYLRKKVKEEEEARYVDLISIKSSPSADNIMTVAYEVNLVSREEERPLYLRCSMVICRRSKRLEITFLHFSKKSERDSSEQLRAFVSNLPCGVMILACLDGQREEAIFYNEYFANRLRYKQDEFARAMAQNPFFMASEEDRDRIHDEIAQARKNGGSITANLRFYRRDGNSFYYRMKGAPAYQADGGTVYYCVFQETTGFQMTTDRLQGRLDTATEILRQIPEAVCVIEYPPRIMEEKTAHANAASDVKKKGEQAFVPGERAGKEAAEAVGKAGSGAEQKTVIFDTGAGSGVSRQTLVFGGDAAEAAGKQAGQAAGAASVNTGKTSSDKSEDGSEMAPEAADGDVKVYRGNRRGKRAAEKAAALKSPAAKITGTGPKVLFTSKNIPSMFGVSVSVFTKNILQDPLYGLEITSITRDRLMSSCIMSPDKAAVAKAVSCGIFRIKNFDPSEEKAIRVELMVRRVKDKDGTMRLYLFYYDREAAQRDMENRVDRAMKMSRAGQEQLRADLRKAKENAARKQSELTASMKEAEKKHAEELTRIENNLANEKKRGVLMSRQLEESKAAQKQIAEERQRIEEDAARRIRNHEARADRQVKEARNARDLLEEQLREALDRSRSLEQQLNREKARRVLLEEQYRQLQEQHEELQKVKQEEDRRQAPVQIAESMGASLTSAGALNSSAALEKAVIYAPADGSSASVSAGAARPAGGTAGSPVGPAASSGRVSALNTDRKAAVRKRTAGGAAVSVSGSTGRAGAATVSAGSAGKAGAATVSAGSTGTSGAAAVPGSAGAYGTFPASSEIREGDWMTQTESLKVFSSMKTDPDTDPVDDFSDSIMMSDEWEDPVYSSDTGSGGKGALREESFSPAAFLQSVIDYEETACAEKNISLRLQMDSRLPSAVIGFAGLLRSALCEIIENAVNRSRPGGTISVHCRADRPSGGLVNIYFRIDDNGTDIPGSGMQAIFETEKATDSDIPVRPVLYAAQEAAALMGGSVHARSSSGMTRFSLTVALRV